jgi:hypothetical protein
LKLFWPSRLSFFVLDLPNLFFHATPPRRRCRARSARRLCCP